MLFCLRSSPTCCLVTFVVTVYTYIITHFHIMCFILYTNHQYLIFFFFISTEESELMRTFYGIDSSKRSKDSETGTTIIDDLSCISSSSVLSGTVKNSLLSNVKCNHIDVDGCVLINVTANSIVAKQGFIVYNIADGTPDGIIITEKVVLAGVFSEDGTHKRMESSTDIDGGTQFYFYFYFYFYSYFYFYFCFYFYLYSYIYINLCLYFWLLCMQYHLSYLTPPPDKNSITLLLAYLFEFNL